MNENFGIRNMFFSKMKYFFFFARLMFLARSWIGIAWSSFCGRSSLNFLKIHSRNSRIRIQCGDAASISSSSTITATSLKKSAMRRSELLSSMKRSNHLFFFVFVDFRQSMNVFARQIFREVFVTKVNDRCAVIADCGERFRFMYPKTHENWK